MKALWAKAQSIYSDLTAFIPYRENCCTRFIIKIKLGVFSGTGIKHQLARRKGNAMYNWSVDEKYLARYPQKYKLWKLEQQLSYGLEGEKVSRSEIISHWPYLQKRLDPQRRKFLEFLLWPKLS